MNQEDIKKKIISRLSVGELSEQEQVILVGDVLEGILQKIFMRILAVLSKEDQEIFASKMDDDQVTEAEIDTFIHDVIPHYDQLAAEVVENYFKEFDAFREEIAQKEKSDD